VTKIFVRERTRTGKGEGLPRLAIIGMENGDLKIFQVHVRKSELDAITQVIDAEIVMLPRGTGKDAGNGFRGGKRQKQNTRQTKKGNTKA
jgi:hypothetical protein